MRHFCASFGAEIATMCIVAVNILSETSMAHAGEKPLLHSDRVQRLPDGPTPSCFKIEGLADDRILSLNVHIVRSAGDRRIVCSRIRVGKRPRDIVSA